MTLSLHRSHKITLDIARPEDETRAFVFDVSLGLGKDPSQVDPLSGMLFNLIQLDQILLELTNILNSKTWSTISAMFLASQEFIETRGTALGAVAELCFYEKRGFWFKSQLGKFLSGREEVCELDSKLFRIRYQFPFDENHWEQQVFKVKNVNDLFSDKVFQDNPGLETIDVENLATSERWRYSLSSSPL